jgi:hypothetical protein
MTDDAPLDDLAGIPDELGAALAPKAAPSRPIASAKPFDGTLHPYAEKALDDECAELAAWPKGTEGGRYRRIFKCTAQPGELVAGGHLPSEMVFSRIFDACVVNGAVSDYGEAKVRAQIEAGLAAGALKPRTVPESTRPRNGSRIAHLEEPAWLREEIAGEPEPGESLGQIVPRSTEPLEPIGTKPSNGIDAVSTIGDVREPGEDREADDDQPMLPESCWRSGFVEFREAYTKTTEASDSFFWVSFAVAASLMLGRSAVRAGGARIFANIFAALVASSGGGRKTIAQESCDRVTRRCDESVVICSGVGSPEALIDALSPVSVGTKADGSLDPATFGRGSRIRALLRLGELSSLLLKGKQDGSRGLLPKLTEAYDCPDVLENRVKRGWARAEEPFLCVYGSTTPEWLRRDLTLDDIRGGLAGRFIYVTGTPKPAIPDPPSPDWKALTEAERILMAARDRHSVDREYRLSPDARERWAAWYVPERARDYGNPILEVLAQRLHTNATKVAMIFAALEGTDEITDEQIGAAIDFATYQRTVQAATFGDFGESDRARLERRVLETIKRRGPLPTWGLRQLIRNVAAEDLRRAVDSLNKIGEIVQRRTKTGRGSAWHLRGGADA